MPAIGYDHPRGAGNIFRGRGGKSHEVTEPGSFGRLRVLAERDDLVLSSHDQQRRRRYLAIFVYAIATGCRSLLSGKNRTG